MVYSYQDNKKRTRLLWLVDMLERVSQKAHGHQRGCEWLLMEIASFMRDHVVAWSSHLVWQQGGRSMCPKPALASGE